MSKNSDTMRPTNLVYKSLYIWKIFFGALDGGGLQLSTL